MSGVQASILTSTVSVVASLLTAGSPRAADSKIIAHGAKLEKLAGGFEFTEGPAADNTVKMRVKGAR